jgi:hypothetical protein
VVLGLEWSVLRPGGSRQAALLGSRVAVIPGRVCHPVSTHPSTTRRGRQLSSSQSAPAAPQLHLCISDQAITPYHNPLNPTTSASFDLSLALALSSCRFGSLPRLSCSKQQNLQSLVSTSHLALIAAAARTSPTSLLDQTFVHPNSTASRTHYHGLPVDKNAPLRPPFTVRIGISSAFPCAACTSRTGVLRRIS